MILGLINSLKGCFVLRAEGRFPERILNIASTSGIYVYDVERDDDGAIRFSVSRKGAQKLLETKIEGITLEIAEKSGIPVFFSRYKKRIALILLPLLFFISSSIFSLFVWQVNIEGGTEILQEEVRRVMSENGVHKGALKYKIDRYDVKRRAIMEIDDLSWLWVDIKGTTANVKIYPRKKIPEMIKKFEPADVVACHDGVIEKMKVYCGIPLFSEGMTVEKGQVVVTGVLRSENENIPTYYHHASADIILKTKEKSTCIIPRKTLEKVPTGNKKTVFSLNFKKNNVNFSLNSGISYTNYDKIRKIVKIPFLPLAFTRTTYAEVNVTEKDTDIAEKSRHYKLDFIHKLEKDKMDVIKLEENVIETPTAVKVTFSAECLVHTDKEIPISKGE